MNFRRIVLIGKCAPEYEISGKIPNMQNDVSQIVEFENQIRLSLRCISIYITEALFRTSTMLRSLSADVIRAV